MKKEKGQAIVEFAIVVPMFIFLFLSVMYIGIMFMDYIQYSNAARAAARDISLQDNDAKTETVAKLNNQEGTEKYAVPLTKLYKAKWQAELKKNETGDTENLTEVEIKIDLKREKLPEIFEKLGILPENLKTITYKTQLENTN